MVLSEIRQLLILLLYYINKDEGELNLDKICVFGGHHFYVVNPQLYINTNNNNP